jgi:hypothetical protein
MIPEFQAHGTLPRGIHRASWKEVSMRFGTNPHRRRLLAGLRKVLRVLRRAGCSTVYLNGSFVTSKETPADYDVCWDVRGVNPRRLDAVFLDFSYGRAAQKVRYGGEFFPAQAPEGASGRAFLEFFQIDKETGRAKGIVAIHLRRRTP